LRALADRATLPCVIEMATAGSWHAINDRAQPLLRGQ
jgi:hypothetical protein